MMQLPTWMTMEEKIRYLDRDEPELADLLRDVIASVSEHEQSIEKLSRREEILGEQVGFARDLLDAIQKMLKESRSIGQAREGFLNLVSESMFER